MDPPGQRFDSWKAIAAYLRRSISAVQRWEREEGLPVHRLEHSKGSTVYALESELAEWLAQRSRTRGPANGNGARRWRWRLPGLGAAAGLVLAGWLVWPRKVPDAGAARSIPLAVSPGREWDATLSPDGTQVAYIWNGDSGSEPFNLYVRPVAGGAARRLTNGRWRDQFPRWSPDGRWIAFGRRVGTSVDVTLISPDAARQRTLAHLENPAYRQETSVEWVTWLPDSKSVAIVEKPSLEEPYAIFRLSIDTGERRQLSFPPRGIAGDRQCAFSPDGRYFAFVRSGGAESDIYLSPAAGGELRRLTRDRIYHNGLAWTPDSREIIYGAQRLSVTWSLWRLNVTGSGAQPVRIGGVQEDGSWPSVALAPGGRTLRIAYTHSVRSANVYRWDDPGKPGAAPRPVCPSTRFDVAAAYSPDGSRVAFASERDGSREIWVCDADGSRPARLTKDLGTYTDSPRWSPDGNHLAFSSAIEDNRDVWIADLRTEAIRRFTKEPSQEGRPSWSSDGRWIYFRSDRSGRDEIWKCRWRAVVLSR